MDTEAQGKIQRAFEAYTRMALQAMVEYVDGDERVDRMWLYTDMTGGGIQTAPFFRYDGKFCDHDNIGDVDGSREYDSMELIDQIDPDLELDFYRACRDAGSIPQRVITEYDPATGALSSQWEYEGVLEGPEDNAGRALDRWVTSMGGDPIFS